MKKWAKWGIVLLLTAAAPALAAEDAKTKVQLQNINAYAAWDRGLNGSGTIVAVLDNGIDPTHVDLVGKVIASKRFDNPAQPVNETKNGHGTAMASIIAGNLNDQGVVGVAYGSKIVFAQLGSGTQVNTSVAGKAALWAAEQGASVANMSFSASFDAGYRRSLVASPSEKGVYIQTDPKRSTGRAAFYGYVDMLPSLQAATNKGIILVMAAGNEGVPYAASPGLLATATDSKGNLILSGRTIIVGGVTSTLTPQAGLNGAGHICTSVAADGRTCLDLYRTKEFFISAPGTTTAAAALSGNGTQVLSGTSIATAYVSGAVAILRQAWPQLRPEQTVQLLFRTARDLGAPGVDEVYGWGLIDLNKATQPFGSLVANVTAAGPKALTPNTAVVGTLMAKTTSFLNGSQFEDQFGRNFSVQLGDAVMSTKSRSFQHPYLGLDGSLIQIFSDGAITAMQSRDGLAFNVRRKAFDIEFGASAAQRQVLGTFMDGYLGVAGSSNKWVAIGANVQSGDWFAAIKTYLGHTSVANSAASAVHFTDLLSFSSAAELTKLGIFTHNDMLTLRTRPVNRVIRGHVGVTRIRGYQFEPAEDGQSYVALPQLDTQSFGVGAFQPTQVGLTYRRPMKRGLSLALDGSFSTASKLSAAAVQGRLAWLF